MIPLTIIISILFTHWIADFILQTNWMAQNKSKQFRALAAHGSVYTLTLATFAILTFDPLVGALWAITNGLLHMLIDYFTSRWSSKLWAKNDIHNFFVVIGFDQLLHAVILLSTYCWLVL